MDRVSRLQPLVLKRLSAPPDRYPAWREAIVKYRFWLRQTGKLPNVEAFKEHFAWKKTYLTPERFEIRREALRWYYRESLPRMKVSATRTSSEPRRLLRPQGTGPVETRRVRGELDRRRERISRFPPTQQVFRVTRIALSRTGSVDGFGYSLLGG